MVVTQLVFVSETARAATVTGSATEKATLIKEFAFIGLEGESAPIDPSGITYLGGGEFLVSDSEINEEDTVYDGVNIWQMTGAPDVVRTAAFEEPPDKVEPTGLAYNPTGNGHIYISNDEADLVFDVNLGPDGDFGTGDDTMTSLDVFALGITDPEDVAWDPVGNQVFVASGVGSGSDPRTVTGIGVGGDGILGTGDDVVGTTMDFTSMIGDLEGLGYRAASDTLLLVDPIALPAETIFEVTKDGRLVREITIGATKNPADVTVAPAFGGGGDNLYLVDRGLDNNSGPPPPRDGVWYEYQTAFENLAPFVDAGSDQVVASGDPAPLVGDSYDDGQGSGYTSPPFIPSFTWSKVSGPGTVTFDDASALSTNANFSTDGVYVLKLQATDGDLVSEDTIQVTRSSSVVSGTFVDDDGNFHEPNIELIAAAGITEGCNPPNNDMYCPGRSVTRAEMAAFLVRSMGLEGFLIDYQGTFPDVPEGEWYTPYVETLASVGVTTGYQDGTYRPNGSVTRAEMAVFLVRAFSSEAPPPAQGVFVDVPPSGWYAAEAEQILADGITTGCKTTPLSYCPNGLVLRDQMASFLARALGIES